MSDDSGCDHQEEEKDQEQRLTDYYKKRLFPALKEHSVSRNHVLVRQEWSRSKYGLCCDDAESASGYLRAYEKDGYRVVWRDDKVDYTHCTCGVKIKSIFIIANHQTKCVCIVGCECIEVFDKQAAKDLRSIRNDQLALFKLYDDSIVMPTEQEVEQKNNNEEVQSHPNKWKEMFKIARLPSIKKITRYENYNVITADDANWLRHVHEQHAITFRLRKEVPSITVPLHVFEHVISINKKLLVNTKYALFADNIDIKGMVYANKAQDIKKEYQEKYEPNRPSKSHYLTADFRWAIKPPKPQNQYFSYKLDKTTGQWIKHRRKYSCTNCGCALEIAISADAKRSGEVHCPECVWSTISRPIVTGEHQVFKYTSCKLDKTRIYVFESELSFTCTVCKKETSRQFGDPRDMMYKRVNFMTQCNECYRSIKR
jgi:hypothetical protein